MALSRHWSPLSLFPAAGAVRGGSVAKRVPEKRGSAGLAALA